MPTTPRETAPLVICLVQGIVMLVPLWSVELLPLLDWPQHVAMVSVLAHMNDPAWGFDEYFVHAPQITTHVGFLYSGALLAQGMSGDTALRVLLSLYFLGTPLALAHLLASLGRSRWAATLLGPALFSWTFYMGFGANLVSMPLMLLCLGLVIRSTDQISRGRAIGIAVGSTVLFLTHSLTYGVFLLASGCWAAITCRLQWRKWGGLLASVLPSFVCFGVWFGTQFVADHDEDLGAATAIGHAPSAVHGAWFGMDYEGFPKKFDRIGQWFNEGLRGDTDRLIYHLWLGVIGAALLIGLALSVARTRKIALPPMGPWLVAIIFLGLYWVTPMSAGNIWAISPRMILFAACGLTLLVPRMMERAWVQSITALPALALTVYATYVTWDAFRRANEEAKGFSYVLQAADRGKRLYGVVYNSGSAVMSQPIYLHFPAYYMGHRGGLTGFTFINNPSLPMRLRVPGSSPYPGKRGEWEPRRVRFDLLAPYYDYFLAADGGNVRSSLRAPQGGLREVRSAGRWKLFENIGSRRVVDYSFLENVQRAQVTHGSQACGPFSDHRFVCSAQSWNWVGPSEQRFNRVPTPCIWAHPTTDEVTHIKFDGVPATGDRIIGFHGVADSGQRGRPGSPVTLSVLVDGAPVGTFQTGVRPGYQTFEVPVPVGTSPKRVQFDVTTQSAGTRHYCFGATLFRPSPEPASLSARARASTMLSSMLQ